MSVARDADADQERRAVQARTDSGEGVRPEDRGTEGLTTFEQQTGNRSLIDLLNVAGGDLRQGSGAGGPSLTLGDFEIGRVIGRGGMGVVYEAIQKSLNRRVALKILPASSADEPRRIERFRIEAMAAACLRHPHIVPVYLTGSERGVHFYAMQLIEGQTLAALIRRRLPHREVAKFARQAADALQYAHERGIVHRDIKPSNLLVDESGHLWVSDFGLARVAGQSDLTLSGAIVGTLRYMSPEQASGSRSVIDHRTDVYSLGVTLYELITGRPLFCSEQDGRLGLLRQVVEAQPQRPRLLDASIPRDLETIALKALAKDPAGRYATAGEMAEDLDRFLHDRPILARAPGPLDHAAMWVRRNRKPVAATAALILAVLIGTAYLLRRHNAELTAALGRARDHERATRQLLYGSRMRLAQQVAAAGEVELAQEIIAGLKPDDKGEDLRGFGWHHLDRVLHREVTVLTDHLANVLYVAPGGDTLFSGGVDGGLLIHDLVHGKEVFRERTMEITTASNLALSRDGAYLAAWGSGLAGRSWVKLWDARSRTLLATLPEEASYAWKVSFLGDSRTVAVQRLGRQDPPTNPENRLQFWRISPEGAVPAPGIEPIDCATMSVSPDGRLLATLTKGVVTLRDGATGRPIKDLPGSVPGIPGIEFSPDSTTLAISSTSTDFWDGRSRRRIGNVPSRPLSCMTFSPDGDKLAGISDDNDLVLVADVRTAPRRVPLEGSEKRTAFAFSPDGRELAGGGGKHSLRRWDAATGRILAEYPYSGVGLLSVAYTPDGTSLILGSEDVRIRARKIGPSPAPFERTDAHRSEIWGLAFSPDGSTLISSADDATIKLWSPRHGSPIATLAGHKSLVAALALSPDGRTLASASFDTTLRLWDLPGGKVQQVLSGHWKPARAVAFSRDGRLVASGGNDGTVRLWDAADGRAVAAFRISEKMVRALSFAPTDPLIIASGEDRTLRGIEIADGRTRFSIRMPRECGSLAYSPDGKTLAAGDDWGGLTIWDADMREPPRIARDSDAAVWGLAFSPDGKTLAAACGDAKVRLWDPSTGQVTLVLDGHTERVNAVAFSPDGHTLASAGHDGSIILWRDGLGRADVSQ